MLQRKMTRNEVGVIVFEAVENRILDKCCAFFFQWTLTGRLNSVFKGLQQYPRSIGTKTRC